MRRIHWFFVIALGVLGFVLWRSAQLPPALRGGGYDYQVVGVSEGLTERARALDLAKNLDVALLPEIGKQVVREAAQRGLKEQAFLVYLVRETSNRIREISTIDLNADGQVDPILVKPEPVQGEQYVLLSVRVPEAKAYPLPAASDQAAWRNVETLEVATLTLALSPQALTVQAQANPQAYGGQQGQPYVVQDRTPNFLQMYFALRMVDWLFAPRGYGFWGPGFGYGRWVPVPVPTTERGRGATIGSRGYTPAPPSGETAIRSRSGAPPTSSWSRAYSQKAPSTLGDVRSSTPFRTREGAPGLGGGLPGGAGAGGGFGRSRSFGSAPVPAPSSPRFGAPATPRVRGFSTPSRGSFGGGFGRGYSRGLGGGFGRGFRR